MNWKFQSNYFFGWMMVVLLLLLVESVSAQSFKKAIVQDSVLNFFFNPDPPKAEFILSLDGDEGDATKYYTPIIDGPLFPVVHDLNNGQFYWLHGYGALPSRGRILVSEFAPVTKANLSRDLSKDWRSAPLGSVFKKNGPIERTQSSKPKRVARSVRPIFDWLLLNYTSDPSTWYQRGVLPNDIDITFLGDELLLYLRKKNQIEFWRRLDSSTIGEPATWENTLNFSQDSIFLEPTTNIPGKIRFDENRTFLSREKLFLGKNSLLQINGAVYLFNHKHLTMHAIRDTAVPIFRLLEITEGDKIFGEYFFIEDRDVQKIYFPGMIEIINDDDNLPKFKSLSTSKFMAKFIN